MVNRGLKDAGYEYVVIDDFAKRETKFNKNSAIQGQFFQ
jgi:hypothetical protein